MFASVTSPPYERGESVESPLGGYGLIYRGRLAEFGIVARAGTLLGDLPITVDVLTESDCAAHMAAGFRSAVEATEYFQRWMLSTDPLPAEVLRDYAEVACLCRLPYLTGRARCRPRSLLRWRPSVDRHCPAAVAEVHGRCALGRGPASSHRCQLAPAGGCRPTGGCRCSRASTGSWRSARPWRSRPRSGSGWHARWMSTTRPGMSATRFSGPGPTLAVRVRYSPATAPTARPGCLARRSAVLVAPRRARGQHQRYLAGGLQAHAPARVRKAAGRPCIRRIATSWQT